MTVKNLLTFQAIVAFLFGLLFVLLPEMALEPYMITEDQMTPTAAHMARLFGALLLAFAVGCWIQRSHTNHRHWMYMIFGVNIINALINTQASLNGLFTPFNWSSVVIVIILAAWAGYVLFVKKEE